MNTNQHNKGFTLTELMIVVAIIGILVALAIPSMLHAGHKSRRTVTARDIQTAAVAFMQYSSDHDAYPADTTPAQMPDGMAEYLNKFNWLEETPVGGQWDWDYQQFGCTAGVSIFSPKYSDHHMRKIDEAIDDGQLSSGMFRKRPGGYIYIIEE